MSVTLSNVVPWGRSLEEYRSMFSLTDHDLSQKILGIGDGPASFNAQMHSLGHPVLSLDPLYTFTAQEIQSRVHATYDSIISQVKQHPQNFCWDRFPTPHACGQARLAAMQTFLADYPLGLRQGRYLPASLPHLPLADQTFDLALCSHLLFLYSEQFSLDFHLQSIRELCRVSRELRIFPLQDLSCRASPHLPPVIESLTNEGYTLTPERVPYEFQRGSHTMLRITRPLLV